jgi:hypothetical protein
MLACCAFAVFLLNQLLLPLTFVRERLWGRGRPVANAAVVWRPGDPMAVRAVARRSAIAPRPALILLVALETLAVGGSVAAGTIAAAHVRDPGEQRLLAALHNSICRAVGKPLS